MSHTPCFGPSSVPGLAAKEQVLIFTNTEPGPSESGFGEGHKTSLSLGERRDHLLDIRRSEAGHHVIAWLDIIFAVVAFGNITETGRAELVELRIEEWKGRFAGRLPSLIDQSAKSADAKLQKKRKAPHARNSR